jgi:hypothetical protein
MKSKQPSLPQIDFAQFAFQDRLGKFVPVSFDFPYDTDYSWRRFCYAQFWVIPVETETNLWEKYAGPSAVQGLDTIIEEEKGSSSGTLTI